MSCSSWFRATWGDVSVHIIIERTWIWWDTINPLVLTFRLDFNHCSVCWFFAKDSQYCSFELNLTSFPHWSINDFMFLIIHLKFYLPEYLFLLWHFVSWVFVKLLNIYHSSYQLARAESFSKLRIALVHVGQWSVCKVIDIEVRPWWSTTMKLKASICFEVNAHFPISCLESVSTFQISWLIDSCTSRWQDNLVFKEYCGSLRLPICEFLCTYIDTVNYLSIKTYLLR